MILLTSCQITETINLNPDGSGSIEAVLLRDENSYMQLMGDKYFKEEEFLDTTFVFKDYIKKYKETFSKYSPQDQKILEKYSNVKLHLKKSSFEKEFRDVFLLDFNNLSEIPDLYKSQFFADDLKNNYVLNAEKHYYKTEYTFDGTVFKRKVSITNQAEFEKTKEEFKKQESVYKGPNLVKTYILKYHFPREIKSVSNEKAVISSDKKMMTLEFSILDCLLNPEMTSLEVILE